MALEPGKFITFEGGEGSGKTTQIKLLHDKLRAQNIPVVVTREPGGTPFAETVRTLLLNPDSPAHDALSQALLFYAARHDHLKTLIKPQLSIATWVISDRFVDSSYMYQGVAGKLPPEFLQALDRLVVGKCMPDLTVVIDVPAKLGLSRAALRRGLGRSDVFEAKDIAYHEALRAGYLLLGKAFKRCYLVDGTKTIDEIAQSIWACTTFRFLTKFTGSVIGGPVT